MKSKIKIIIIFVLFVTSFLLINTSKDKLDSNFHAYFLNVGQGDAMYARVPSGEDILIDGGPDLSVLTELGKVMPYSDRTISYVVLTHPHADHLFGLIEVLKRYEVKNIILTDAVSTTQEYQEFLNIIKDKQIHTILAKADDDIDIDNNFKFEIFYPNETFNGREVANLNNTSIVGRLVYDNFSIITTGDAETDLQEKIVKKYSDNLQSDIIKIAHHGSKNGINENFLDYANPEIAVISVGADNKFGHPHANTIKTLNQENIKTFRTDEDGTIEVISDRVNFWTNLQK